MNSAQNVSEAQARAQHWHAEAQLAAATGRVTKAERCFHKADFWATRANQQNSTPQPQPRKH